MTVSEEAPPWTGGAACADDAPPEAAPVAPPPALPVLPPLWAAVVRAGADCVGCAGAWAAGALVAAAVGAWAAGVAGALVAAVAGLLVAAAPVARVGWAAPPPLSPLLPELQPATSTSMPIALSRGINEDFTRRIRVSPWLRSHTEIRAQMASHDGCHAVPCWPIFQFIR